MLFKEIKKKFKENYKIIIIFIVTIFLLTLDLPFYIDKTGGVIDISNRIEDSIDYEGTLNMTYVSSLKGTPITGLIAILNPNWDIISKTEENGNGSEEDTTFRNEIALEESIDSAILTSYKYASKNIKILNEKIYVTYIYDEANTNLKVGDIIKEINNNSVKTKSDITEYLDNLNIGDKVDLKVINNEVEYNRYAYVMEYNNKKILGIICYVDYELEYSPKLKINFQDDESGPSGGLMLTLAIYSNLINEDITMGKNISGTGTIDEFGNVGSISGIKYKLRGAVKSNMDVFLVPSGSNYKEAMKEKEKNNYNIEIYSIDTFEDAIKILKELE